MPDSAPAHWLLAGLRGRHLRNRGARRVPLRVPCWGCSLVGTWPFLHSAFLSPSSPECSEILSSAPRGRGRWGPLVIWGAGYKKLRWAVTTRYWSSATDSSKLPSADTSRLDSDSSLAPRLREQRNMLCFARIKAHVFLRDLSKESLD